MQLKKVTREELDIPELSYETTTRYESVTALTQAIRSVLDGEFGDIVVVGEVTGWTEAASGHRYFSLKDAGASLSCTMWRTRSLPARIGNGMTVVATGSISVYAPRGSYQLDCRTITPLGEGALHLAFEKLKRALAEEGLFDNDRKKPLPSVPRVIGIVTSPTGAALRDIITTIRRRWPSVRLIFAPASVQGVRAADEIVRSIERLDAHGAVDLMIVGRGGGSLEDLWPFNEERVARAIAAAATPIISAVGHETDFTIADFVADLRAATPTAAAEIAVPDRLVYLSTIVGHQRKLDRGIDHRFTRLNDLIVGLLRSRGLHRPMDAIRRHEQHLDELLGRLQRADVEKRRSLRERLHKAEISLNALNPESLLRRGYAVIRRDDQVVTSSEALGEGDHVEIRMHDGRRYARITSR